jgi:hypothetical protein
LLLVATLSACAPASPTPLANTFPSAEALAAAALEAIARRDVTALRSFALDEQEFRDHVWPQLPAARPERNLPFSYVWGDLRQKSDAGLQAMLANHGGKRYELLALERPESPTRYVGSSVHHGTMFKVRDEQGVERELRLCGSFLEKDGQWKVFSFVIDD